jgi:hypothetical protein
MSRIVPENIMKNYLSALTKISFMRMARWEIWMACIFHFHYTITVRSHIKNLLVYKWPENEFDCKYDHLYHKSDDQLKKIVKILIALEDITKSSLRSPEVDDYTVNNLYTILSSNKPLSAQLFSRFIRIAKLGYNIDVYDKNDRLVLSYIQA